MQFLGASIIAGIVFFLLNFLNSLMFEVQVSVFVALFEAIIKTAVFVTIFHYAHNWIAGLLRWYRLDDPNAKHTWDKNPALEEVRAKQAK